MPDPFEERGSRGLRVVESAEVRPPAARLPESQPPNLPVALSTFIGREREIDEVKRLLEGNRLLTLTGPGGAGKRLYLSPRTVGQHLRSIYRKLGVPTRAAAVKAAVERSLI